MFRRISEMASGEGFGPAIHQHRLQAEGLRQLGSLAHAGEEQYGSLRTVLQYF